VVVNATGAYTDSVRRMDDPGVEPMIQPSQGIHLVLAREFLPGDTAIMVPHTDDGRVLFAIPWYDRVVIGTTDTPVTELPLEPQPLEAEVEFLLKHASRYLRKDPSRRDVLSVFAGLRPLVRVGSTTETASLSRDHAVHIARSGLLTVAGGKWTTYRKMAEDTVDQAVTLAGLEPRACVTSQLNIHGFHQHAQQFGELAHYGADALAIDDLLRSNDSYQERLHPELPFRAGEIVWAVEREMARTVDDFLARRTRSLLFDARAASEIAPEVAAWMAQALGHDKQWEAEQVTTFRTLARGYLLA
jgi:glycerol-3-phosphate dehydrogenase